MKTKYLFGMLLSGAMLAACTADDDFKAPVVQEVNPSAPVFNISFENDGLENRGIYHGLSSQRVELTTSDLLSLFHGAPATATPSNGTAITLTGMQSAIYTGENDEDGNFTYSTAAMVQPGYAVMVFPADVAFRNNPNGGTLASAPVIMVSQKQDATTKDTTAYMSELLKLKIKPGKTDSEAAAGYNVDYNIVLKRAAGTFNLVLNTGETAPVINGLDPIKIKSVTLKSDDKAFATQGTITAKATDVYAKTTSYWAGTTEIASDAATAVTAVTTTDISENQDTARFTLLPLPADVTPTNCQIVVETTYGVVTIKNSDYTTNTPLWVNESLKTRNVSGGIKDVFGAIHGASKESSTFKKNWTGKYANATLNVDLSKVKLDGMHIKTSEELKTALKVFDALSKTEGGEKAITLYLDGDSETGVFVVEDNETWNAVKDHMAEAEYSSSGALEAGVSFVPCKDIPGEACTIVRLVNEDKANAKPVPSLRFTTNPVSVELQGLWEYDGVLDDAKTDVNEGRDYANVNNLTVLSGSKLTLANNIIAYNWAKGTNSTMKIINRGTVDASGKVTLLMSADNYGTINIPATGSLDTNADDVTLTNMEAQDISSTNKATGWWQGALIDNYGRLSVQGDKGRIENYGLIKSQKGAQTLISTNGSDEGTASSGGPKTYTTDLETKFNDKPVGKEYKNRIGTIYIFEPLKAVNNLVTVDEDQGFIKLDVSKTNAAAADFGDVANYIKLTGTCEGVTISEDKDGKDVNLPKTVKYIEVASSNNVMFTVGNDKSGNKMSYTLVGLFMQDGGKVTVPEATEMTITGELYLKGQLTIAGEVTGKDKLAGYHGGVATDVNNKFGKGELK